MGYQLYLGGGFKCSPRSLGLHDPNLTSIFFEMGWFNHQLYIVYRDAKALAICGPKIHRTAEKMNG